MTAETDIAAIADGGNNSPADVRTALTSVLSNVPATVQYLTRRLPGETAHALDDFFDDDTLSGTAVDAGATGTWVEKYGRLGVIANGGGSFPSEPTVRIWPLTGISSPPVTFETRLTLFSAGNLNLTPGVLIGFSNGAVAGSTFAGVFIYRDNGSGRMSFYKQSGTFNAVVSDGIFTNNVGSRSDILVRAVWTATNTFEYSFSGDGLQWTDKGESSHSETMTPTHFFVGASSSATLNYPASFDYIRINETDLSP